uniref:Glycosyltransferase RgtA/B/C/D-like domain-containing protein n=1 Tax=Thermosporothrix sp. COM3 TaxID=2490863 RepID=A0A455SMY8_9CHLR|nr:hypothetical protein KTC_30330 [Thermosporothrix sp. COM3]
MRIQRLYHKYIALKRTPIRDTIWLFIVTRLVLFAVTYFAYLLLTTPTYLAKIVTVPSLLSAWNLGESTDYIRIARYGYQSLSDFAYFPLYPLLVGAVGNLTDNYFLVGMILSNLAFLAALIFLYHIIAFSIEEKVAHYTILYYCIFPTSFYFFTAYNTSFLLLFSVGTFWALQRRYWWRAGLFGMLASLTSPFGLLLLLPYLATLIAERRALFSSVFAFLNGITPLLLFPFCILFINYCAWLATGDRLALLTVELQSGREFTYPWEGIIQTFSMLFGPHALPAGSSLQVHLIIDLCITLFFLVLWVVGLFRLPFRYSLWSFGVLFVLLSFPAQESPDVLQPNQHMLLLLFPMLLTLAFQGKKHPGFHQSLFLIFPVFLALFSITFILQP